VFGKTATNDTVARRVNTVIIEILVNTPELEPKGIKGYGIIRHLKKEKRGWFG